MKKNFKKPLKSLMLTAMALLTATATAVNASSYSIIIEHIWDDNNNAYGTRPDEIKTEIDQVRGDGSQTGADLDFTENGQISDNGFEQGKTEGEAAAIKGDDVLKQEAEEKGREDGAQAGADAKDRLEDVKKENELADPNELPDPDSEEWNLVSPDDPKLQPENVLKDFEKDGKQYTFSDAEKQKYRDSLAEYKVAYETYVAGKDQEGSYANYKAAYEKMAEALKAISKAGTTSRPGGSDAGFTGGFQDGLENGGSKLTTEELNDIYNDAYQSAFDDAYQGKVTVETTDEAKNSFADEYQKEVGNYDADNRQTAEEIANKVNKIVEDMVNDAMGGDLWKTETELEADHIRDENGKPLNYRPGEVPTAEVNEKGRDYLKETIGVSEDELKELGYTTTQLRIEITIVEDKDEDGNPTGQQRVYVSVDGGKHFEGVNEAAKGQKYDPSKDIVDVTKLTFLHTLEVKYEPPVPEVPEVPEYDDPVPQLKSNNNNDNNNNNNNDNNDNDDNDDNNIPEDGVPLADIEEEPEESIPEEEVPLTDVPKTGDNSLIWMCAAMFSGTALLALLKKEKEAQEA